MKGVLLNYADRRRIEHHERVLGWFGHSHDELERSK
jgi:hypothetical protein